MLNRKLSYMDTKELLALFSETRIKVCFAENCKHISKEGMGCSLKYVEIDSNGKCLSFEEIGHENTKKE